MESRRGVVGFALLATFAMITSGAFGEWNGGGQGSGKNHTTPPTGTTPFYPYIVNPAAYPLPTNLTSPANSSLPIIATITQAALTSYLLLYVAHNGSRYSLDFAEGSYSPSVMSPTTCPSGATWGGRGWNNGASCSSCPYNQWGNSGDPCSACPSQDGYHGGGKNQTKVECPAPELPDQPIAWGIPYPILNSTVPITRDAFAANGTGAIAGATVGSTSEFFLDSVLGSKWVEVASLSGSNPAVAISGNLAVAVATGSKLQVTTVELSSLSVATQSLAPALNATPLISPNGHVEVVASASNETLEFYSSTNSGVTFGAPDTLARFQVPSSSIFKTIGDTFLQTPGGVAGQVTAAQSGNDTFVLYTTELQGRIVGATIVSSDFGVEWNGPYDISLPLGALQSPSVTVAPVGYVYATWQLVSGGLSQPEQAVFNLNGQMEVSPSPLPGPAGQFGTPSIAIDLLERPIYVWSEQTPRGGSRLVYDSAFLAPANSFLQLREEVVQLVPSDFVNATTANSSRANILANISSIEKLAANSTLGSWQETQGLSLLESRLYPMLTSVPLDEICGAAGPWAQGPEGGAPCEPPSEQRGKVCGFHSWAEKQDSWWDQCPTSKPTVTDLIANESGPFVANKILVVYLDWIIESLGQEVAAPAPGDPVFTGPGWTMTVIPVVYDPMETMFQVEISFQITQTVTAGGGPAFVCFPGAPTLYPALVQTYYPSQALVNLTATLNNTSSSATLDRFFWAMPPGQSITDYDLAYLPAGWTNWLWVAGYSPSTYQMLSWRAWAETQFTDVVSYVDPCNATVFSSYGATTPLFYTGNATGNLGPNLGILGGQPTIDAAVGSPDDGLSVHLNTTMLSTVWVNVTGPSGYSASVTNLTGGCIVNDNLQAYNMESGTYLGPVYTQCYNFNAFLPAAPPGNYTFDWSIRSMPGCSFVGEGGLLGCLPYYYSHYHFWEIPCLTNNGIQGFQGYPDLTACMDFYQANMSAPQTLTGSTTIDLLPFTPYGIDLTVSEVTSTSANITFYCEYTCAGTGYVTYSESGYFTTGPIEAISFFGIGGCKPHGPNGIMCYSIYITTEFSVLLTGLSQLTQYNVAAAIEYSLPGYNLLYEGNTSFVTTGSILLQENDLPYDSITQEGGGANVVFNTWSLPPGPVPQSILPSFVSGYVSWSPVGGYGSAGMQPISFLSPVPGYPGDAQLNISTLVENTTYALSLTFNATSSAGIPINVTSQPYTFTYLAQEFKGGLTNVEKELGWPVWYTAVNGALNYPNGYPSLGTNTSNGLVDDYVEKQYGLNPRSLDTAGSGMLDTFNMTFDVGPAASAPTSFPGLELWTENSENPFAFCPIPTTLSGCPFAQATPSTTNEPSNISDNSPWSSQQLWSFSALTQLETLISSTVYGAPEAPLGYLRAVTGLYMGERTVTVWGKLSWGANPLAASTPGDGIPDGARVNPLHDEALQIDVTTAGSDECGNAYSPPQGTGVALRFYVNTSTASGAEEDSGFSSQVIMPSSGSCGSGYQVTNYVETLPVNNQVQYQHLDVQIAAQYSGQSYLQQLPLSGCTATVSTTISLVTYAPQTVNAAGSTSCSSLPGAVGLTAYAVPSGLKDPTYLWEPTDNSSLSNLPEGLQRYVGEQDFVLVVANISAAMQSGQIIDPWGATGYQSSYQLNLGQGLVNFLIPRGQFLYSPFGMAVLGGTDARYDASSPLPVVGGSMSALACYWQALAVTQNANLCGGSGGTLVGSEFAVSVVADDSGCSSSDGGNCAAGGDPGNPDLEAGNPAPALQSVISMNITSSGELDDLVAALLDNSTGGVNGTLDAVTYELPTLGINSIIMGAVANQIQTSDGIFGAPQAAPPPPSNPCSSWYGCLWNDVTGTIEAIGGVFWNAVKATVVFLHEIAVALAEFLEQAIEPLVGYLDAVGSILLSALEVVAAFIEAAVQVLIASFLTPLISSLEGSLQPMLNAIGSIQTSISDGQDVSVAQAAAFWENFGGPILLVGLVISSAIAVAYNIVNGVSLGSGFLISIVIGLLISLVLAAILAIAPSSLSAFTSIGYTAVFGVEDLINGTTPSQWQAADPPPQQADPCSYQTSWDSFAMAFGLIEDAISFQLSLGFLAAAYIENIGGSMGAGQFTAPIIDMDVAILGLTLDVIADAEQSGGNYDLGLSLAITSEIVSIFGIIHEALEPDYKDPYLAILDKISTGVDVSNAALSGFTIATDVGLCLP